MKLLVENVEDAIHTWRKLINEEASISCTHYSKIPKIEVNMSKSFHAEVMKEICEDPNRYSQTWCNGDHLLGHAINIVESQELDWEVEIIE